MNPGPPEPSRALPGAPGHAPASRSEFGSLRAFLRVMAVVGVVGITLFTWIHRAAAPAAVDPIWQRVLLVAACLVLLAATWRLRNRALVRLAYVIYYLLTAWVLELLVLNSFAQEYALAAIVVSAGIAGTYRDRRQLLVYQLFSLLGMALAAVLVPDPAIDLLVYFAYALVMAVLVFVAVAARLDVDLQRADSEERYAATAEALVHEATHDRLTGLPNRALALDRIERLLAASRRRPDFGFAVLALDVDRFQRINDSLGHGVGDLLLREVARRLSGALRDEDTLARIGADEFSVVAPGVRTEDDILRVAERLRTALGAPFQVARETLQVSASMGITVGPGSYDRPDELLRDANLAMQRVKRSEIHHVQIYDDAMHRQAVEQLRTEYELRRALTANEFELHYQPIVNLGTGRLDGFEALLRWRHPERGLLLPATFLRTAEETGLIVDIGRWALREACAARRRWRTTASALPPGADASWPHVHVNLSVAHFRAGTLLGDVEAALEGEGRGAGLGIEITESVLLADPDAAADILTMLRALGVAVSIDDFGTGYSSLSYLHSLPADVLKIDRSFVGRTAERGGLELVRTIVVLGQRLGLATVAEGVESAAQAERLVAAGASHAQGFHYSAAVPEAQALGALDAPRPA